MTVTAVSDANVDYYPYGQCMDLRTSKVRDAESGLDYFGARYYDGNVGRFFSIDPLFFQASMLSDPQKLNPYSYVRNSPLVLIDPSGAAAELTGNEEQRQKQLQFWNHSGT